MVEMKSPKIFYIDATVSMDSYLWSKCLFQIYGRIENKGYIIYFLMFMEIIIAYNSAL